MAIFRGFGPRHAAGLSERPNFFFAIVIWHPNERSVRVSALNSKILSFSTPFCVVKYKSSCVFPMCAHLSGSAVFLIDEEEDFNAIKIAMTWKIRKEFKNPQK